MLISKESDYYEANANHQIELETGRNKNILNKEEFMIYEKLKNFLILRINMLAYSIRQAIYKSYMLALNGYIFIEVKCQEYIGGNIHKLTTLKYSYNTPSVGI